MAGVAEVALYRAPGDELAVEGDFRDRIGHVIACADGFDAAAAAAERARDRVRIRVEAHAAGGHGQVAARRAPRVAEGVA
jgi:biotin carboxylase